MGLVVKRKTVNDHDYYYLVYKYRVGERVKEKHIRYLGKEGGYHHAEWYQDELDSEEKAKIKTAMSEQTERFRYSVYNV